MANIADLAKVSNVEFWNMARKASPSFASHTAKGTSELFTEKGFEALNRTDASAINEYIEISLRVAFQMLNVSKAKNPLEGSGLVQRYATPNGGFTQRMAVDSIKPITPGFKGIKDGDIRSPFLTRKPKTTERFFAQNFDYQNTITLQPYQIKTIFIEDNGVGIWTAGVMEGLRNGYTVQEYENTLEALNKAINSDRYPLQDTQAISLTSWTGEGTADELKAFILTVKNLASAMDVVPQTTAYNAAKFNTAINVEDHVLLVRPGLKNRIQVELEVGAFNPDRLTLPFEIQEVANFGGLEAYKEADYETKLYPVYDELGAQIGWSEQEGQTGEENVTVEEGEQFYKDPNEQAIAVLAQKGLIFTNEQNPYEVSPIYNPRTMTTHYWANRPNNAINVDPYFDLVLITKPDA